MAESAKDRRAREAIENLSRQLCDMREERDALAAHVEGLTSVVEKLRTVAPEYLDRLAADAYLVLRNAPTASLARHDADLIGSLRFPTMLRKMWSGGDVQQWLDEQADEYRRQAGEVVE